MCTVYETMNRLSDRKITADIAHNIYTSAYSLLSDRIFNYIYENCDNDKRGLYVILHVRNHIFHNYGIIVPMDELYRDPKYKL